MCVCVCECVRVGVHAYERLMALRGSSIFVNVLMVCVNTDKPDQTYVIRYRSVCIIIDSMKYYNMRK